MSIFLETGLLGHLGAYIKNLLNSAISDIETKKVIGNLFTELRYEERNYWNNAYYKLGIVDGIKIAAEARKVEKGMK